MSIFTMVHVNAVTKMNLSQAHKFVVNIIADDKIAKDATKSKALYEISKARSTTQLAMTMSNWILAHPDEGLKVI